MAGSLATVAQLASYLQVTLADDDPTGTLMLSIASGMVRDYLHQALDSVLADVVVLDPINGAYVVLPELPVTGFNQLELLDEDGVTWNVADPTTYTVSTRLGMIAGQPGCGVFWPSLPGTWRVTYSHGFATLPDSLLGVVLGVAARACNSPAAIDLERIGAYQVKYAVEADGFSAIELSTLNSYRDTLIS